MTLKSAVTLTTCCAVTGIVVIWKVAVVCPVGTIIVAGTTAALLLLESKTVIPPLGAMPVRVTVPCADCVPTTAVGEIVRDITDGELIVRVAILEAPSATHVTLTGVSAETASVFAVNVAEFWPAVTVTLAGTMTAPLLLERETTVPPTGAAVLSVTVPVAVVPPMTAVGLNVRDVGVGPR